MTARNISAAEFHRQLCEVYAANAMSEGKVRKWAREFNYGREIVHDNDRSGRPSLITNVVALQNHSNGVLGQAQCFASELYGTRNHNQLRSPLCNPGQAPTRHSEQKTRHADIGNFAPPRQCKASHCSSNQGND